MTWMLCLPINLLLQTGQLGSGKFTSTGQSYLPAGDVFSSPWTSQKILVHFNPGNEELLFPATPRCLTPLKHRTGRNSVNSILARKLFFSLASNKYLISWKSWLWPKLLGLSRFLITHGQIQFQLVQGSESSWRAVGALSWAQELAPITLTVILGFAPGESLPCSCIKTM